MNIGDREIIEAALFAAGGALDLEKLKPLVSKRAKIAEIIRSIKDEYRKRDTGLEIIEIEGKYVMQVKPEYAEMVRSIAPKELASPVLRTLSMIAYHQPILQSDLVEIRGNATYDHVRELEERGLVVKTPRGRSQVLNTSPFFSEYFGLESSRPEFIKEKIIELAKKQGTVGLEKWLGLKKPIGVTRGYMSLMHLLGIENYKVVDPYHPSEEDIIRIKGMEKIVISKEYGEKVSEYFNGEIIEVQAVTFDDLIRTIEKLSHLGKKDKVNEAIKTCRQLQERYISKAIGVSTRVRPATDMVAHLISDMKLNVSAEGLLVAPDYGFSSQGVAVSKDADILVPTHNNAPDDMIERVCRRYEAILNGIAEKNLIEKSNNIRDIL